MSDAREATAAAPLRVLLVDDHAMVRSGFTMMLSVEDDLEVVGQAANGAEAVVVAREARPDVVLMDVQMPVMDGIEATRRIVAEDLGRVVVLTTFDRDDYLFDALDAGASGFLLKNTDPETLITAVHQVAAGHGLLSPEVTLKLIRHRSAPAEAAPDADGQDLLSALTERELQVLTELAKGKNNQEIAAVLSLSEATVKTHLSNLLAKLHLRDRVQGVLFAHRVGLIQ